MYQKIQDMITSYEPKMIAWRRDVHHYAESAFLEMRTASKIARMLFDWGYDIVLGEDACDLSKAHWTPTEDAFERRYVEALEEGADPEFIKPMRHGNTAVIATLDCGEGPVVCMHCELDGVGVDESMSQDHRPRREGFASIHPKMMHACGHDGNQAVCLAIAKALSEIRDQLHGKMKFIFKPADEQGQGAYTILPKGHLDDVDYLFSTHVYEHYWFPDDPGRNMMADFPDTFAAYHFSVDMYGKGVSAAAPQDGKNVAMSMATAILNLQALPRHGKGATHVNVGIARAGEAGGTIPKHAYMEISVKGQTQEICEYMRNNAYRVIKAAAEMYDVTYEIHEDGASLPILCDKEVVDRIMNVATKYAADINIKSQPGRLLNGEDDYSFMQDRVRSHGGLSTDTQQITDVYGLPHGETYDFDESCLVKTARVLGITFYDILKG